MFSWIGPLLVGYVLGSVPTGYLAVKWLKRVDIRTLGSGRTGGTNVLRAAGWVAALSVGIVDIGKAAAAVALARSWNASQMVLALTGVAAVVGHNYSLFLSLRGGAGTTPTIGAASLLWPWNAVILIPSLLATALGTRLASVGSLTVAILVPLVFALRAALGYGPWAHLVYGGLTSALTLWSLRPNLLRLLRGGERRISI
jgi:glycerol-3-phosphate acyltransferase PlsY